MIKENSKYLNGDNAFYSLNKRTDAYAASKLKNYHQFGKNKKEDRNSGSILEDAIIQLDSLDKIGQLKKPSQYGNTIEERLFNVGLELSITWINRILFLRLWIELLKSAYYKAANPEPANSSP
ncbi:MAG TPA: hypothetical protein VK957_13740 [Lunatimonas sp.]|nr:hypothetical protein [Lunatimonas sp.]